MNHHLIMRTLLLVLAVGSLCAADIPLDDSTIVPGVRVGPVEKGMTLFGLKTLFGGGKVKPAEIPGPEGTTLEGARLFEGTDKELEIIFNPEGAEKEIWDIRIIGKVWKFDNGLKLGMTVEELEKINGRAFTISGFGWDYGGYANFEGGKLAGKVTIRLDPPEAAVIPEALSGDRAIPSSDKKLRALKAKAGEISVIFR